MALSKHSGYNLIDNASDPSAEGEIQRNDTRVKAYLDARVETFAWVSAHEDFDTITGFPDTTTSEMSFNDGTLTLTLQPKSPATEFDYYHRGTRITIDSAKTKQIDDTEGVWWFWLDSAGALQASQTRPLFGTEAFVSYVYWNAEDNERLNRAEERHADTAPRLHEELHNTVGMTLAEGLLIGNYTTSGTGNSNSDAQCSFTDGIGYDEDILIEVKNAVSPSEDFEQILSTIAEIPIYYRDTTGTGDWKKKTATQYPLKEGASLIQYNKLNGTWDVVDASSGYFVATWIFKTNNAEAPIIGILGQGQDNKLADARNNNLLEGLVYGAWPVQEMKPLYRLIFETKSSFGNSVKARLRDVVSLRSVQQSPGGEYVPASHPALGDRDLPNQHPADAIEADTQVFDGPLSSADTDVQLALNTLDEYAKTYDLHDLQTKWLSVATVQIATGNCISDDLTTRIFVASPITADITASGANGLDTGSEAASTWYYIWLIRNPILTTNAGLLSLSSTSPTMPAGYTLKRLVGVVRNNSGSDFWTFITFDSGKDKYIESLEDRSNLRVLSAGSATVWTNIDCSPLVPSISQLALFGFIDITVAGVRNTYFRPNGITPATGTRGMREFQRIVTRMTTDSSQLIQYLAAATSSIYVEVYGFFLNL